MINVNHDCLKFDRVMCQSIRVYWCIFGVMPDWRVRSLCAWKVVVVRVSLIFQALKHQPETVEQLPLIQWELNSFLLDFFLFSICKNFNLFLFIWKTNLVPLASLCMWWFECNNNRRNWKFEEWLSSSSKGSVSF